MIEVQRANLLNEFILTVDLQLALASDIDLTTVPTEVMFSQWANNAYGDVSQKPSDVTIRLSTEQEIQQLNAQYRNKNKPTNVLSFPVDLEPELDLPLLGDVIVCHSVLVTEAKQQGKRLHDHYAHMVTHGILHLCGYDHQSDEQANIMEALETRLLARIGVADPYLIRN